MSAAAPEVTGGASCVTSETAMAKRSVWTTQGPISWPSSPPLMSYTALRDIETCPLRWALRHGEYADIWTGRGYPSAPAGATVAGHVVHVALERVVRAVGAMHHEVPSSHAAPNADPMIPVVNALRSLGGISAVLNDLVQETISEWEMNPRLWPRATEMAAELQRQVPALRPRVQQFLGSVDLGRLRPARDPGGTNMRVRANAEVRPLAPGVYAEVPLVDAGLGWYGKADLLRVGGGERNADDAILDFKTGQAKPDHAFQLRIYALLWARDTRRNPAGRRARKLTVLYGDAAIEVPAPHSDRDLDEVAQELGDRTEHARAAVEHHPPVARPSCEACEWCDVRHMCPAYWQPATRAAITSSADLLRHGIDAGVQILQQQGAWRWVARVREVGALSDEISEGARVLLRGRPHDEHFVAIIRVGARMRVVGAQFVAASEESGGLPVLSLTRSTEAFTVLENTSATGRTPADEPPISLLDR